MAREGIRSFLAIELSKTLKQEALSFVETIQDQYSNFRFLPIENWHLTLHFLGQINPDQLKSLQLELPKAVAQIKPFSISLEDLGAFPKKFPRVLWLGVAGDRDGLLALKKCLDQILKKLHFEIETRPYHPHITIARSKGESKQTFLAPKQEFESKNFDKIHSVTLFQSILSPQGSSHSPLGVFLLGSS
ncbi:MAG: 2'-5' RNA ligase [Omnitrophica bacterium RIFCSPHIGHO2_02_FULL_46_11]|nr:MAG: 2'-5' RNA ligase [Omnitrophica bacterium RIFCSPHIGHO2_02_FULL_46_11]OGW86354.1 MAG: 2'-5' RNA ligase [Omnitrophica bacterium RIFCSPLOWO2_01_FULL_45_10b]